MHDLAEYPNNTLNVVFISCMDELNNFDFFFFFQKILILD